MASIRKHIDDGSLVVIGITFVMSYRNALLAERLKDRLDEVQGALRR
jgi:hypothetical protein